MSGKKFSIKYCAYHKAMIAGKIKVGKIKIMKDE